MISSASLPKVSEAGFSDEELLPELKNGNDQAIGYVYKTFWPMVSRMVMLNNGSISEAKDLYQESMLDFLEKVSDHKFVLTCKLKTYIYSICRRKWLYQLRSRKKWIDIETYTELEDLPEDRIEEHAELPGDDQIKAAITALGEPCRSLLLGFYYEKLSMEQLAAKMNYRSENVAKQQKFRCKDRLKNALYKLC